MIAQRTLKNAIRATGVGVHGGELVSIEIRPAAQDIGIVFRRVDLRTAVSIPAKPEYVIDSTLCTSLGDRTVTVATVEHLMSAFAGLGIDNAYVDIDSHELPIMDGSAGPFVFLIQSAGVVQQNKPKRFIRIKDKIQVKKGESFAELSPYSGFKVNFELDYDHPAIPKNRQTLSIDLSDASYVKEVSRARTYGFVSDYEWLREKNLALGASLGNTVAFDDYNIINQDGLRYDDELVRHKILDVIGDLYLLGHSVIGEFTGYRSGHALNNALLNALLADQAAWEFVTFEDDAVAPIRYLSLAQQGAI